jgi:hypothetical protein
MSSPMSVRQRVLLCCGLVLAFSAASGLAQSVTRSGVEVLLLDSLAGDQSCPQIAVGAEGGYVVWQDNTIDGQSSGIGALRLNNRLNAESNVFRVNYTAAGAQDRPNVAMLSNGGAVVVWQGGKLGFQQIHARFLNPDGSFLTRDIVLGQASATSTKKWATKKWIWVQNKLRRQRLKLQRTVRDVREANQAPEVVGLPDGGAVVVYAGVRKTITNVTDWIPHVTWRKGRYFTNSIQQTVKTQFDYMHDIVMQRLSASGAKVGPEVTVNQFRDFDQRSPSAALLPDGNLLVVWISEQEFARPLSALIEPIPSTRILGENRIVVSGRIVTPSGEPVGDEFRIDGEGRTICANPDVSVLVGGGYTVAWSQRAIEPANGWDIYTRTFAADGTPLAEAARLNTFQAGDQAGPEMAALGSNQLVVWTSMGQDGWREGVFGRLLSGGVAVGDEMRVNITTRHSQRQPAIAAHNGEFFTVWSSFAGVAKGMELLAQRYISSGGLAGGSSGSSSSEAVGNGDGSPVPPPLPQDSASGSGSAALRVSLQGSPDKLNLSWNTVAGAAYQVQASTNLTVWTDFGVERIGSGGADSIKFPSADGASFYRVKRVR